MNIRSIGLYEVLSYLCNSDGQFVVLNGVKILSDELLEKDAIIITDHRIMFNKQGEYGIGKLHN